VECEETDRPPPPPLALSSHTQRAAAALKFAAAAATASPPSLWGTPPWAGAGVRVARCDDTCPSARDGACRDGRGPPGPVACDVGTDCTDCGPYEATLPAWLAGARPVAALAALGVPLFATRTATDPPFTMPHTDPAADVDVSAQLARERVVERGLTQVWRARLESACGGDRGWSAASPPLPSPPLVLDVGANFGWYSIFAASLGCRVVAWEPVPLFRRFFEAGLLLNPAAAARVMVRPAAACAVSGANVTLVVPARGVWGTASVGGANIDPGVDNGRAYDGATAPCEAVDDVVEGLRAGGVRRGGGGALGRVALLKADVEGFEPAALAGAARLLASGDVADVAMEYSPGVYEAGRRWGEVGEWPAMLAALHAHGFTLFHVPDAAARGDMTGGDWGGRLAPLRVISPAAVAADARDAARLAARTLGCPAPPELVALAPHWGACGSIPEGLHPRSFRGTFGHNTNVWAARDPAGLTPGPCVGTLAPDEPLTGWASVERAAVGLGGRPCAGLPPAVQVVHRCACTERSVCGAEEALVHKLAGEGRMVPLAYGDGES